MKLWFSYIINSGMLVSYTTQKADQWEDSLWLFESRSNITKDEYRSVILPNFLTYQGDSLGHCKELPGSPALQAC